MAEFSLARAARNDIFEICEYFDFVVGDSGLSDRFASCAISTFEKLAQTPGLGRPRKFRHHPRENLRSRQVDSFPNHLIFYRSVPNGIEIVRVIHGARDLDAQFGE
jgi:toxin ParE1/3/4